MKIHNNVSDGQLALKPGDMVEVTKDNGSKYIMTVKHEPTKLGGTWVAWIEGLGSVALCRCKPLKFKAGSI